MALRTTRDYAVRRLLAVADVGAVAAALGLTELITGVDTRFVFLGLATLPACLVVFKIYGLYEGDGNRISHSTVDDVPRLFHALLVGLVLLDVCFHLIAGTGPGFTSIVVLGVLAAAGVLGARALVRSGATRWLGPERVLLVGEGPALAVLARKIKAHPEYALGPVGVVSATAGVENNLDLPTFGALGTSDLEEIVDEQQVERVIVSHADLAEPAMLELLRRCRQLCLRVSVVPQLFDALGPSVEIDDVEGVTLLGINPPLLSRSSRLLKRTMDILGAGLLLILCGPLFGLIALAIKLDSKGPVFFRQERVGRSGQRFRLLKFRTMVRDADQKVDQALWALSRDPHWLLVDDDPRVTRVGRFLRLSSLDELPQLWNVLKGEMSLVGPRPLVEAEDSRITGWGRTRLDLTPGVTGLWQVLGRTNIAFAEMVKLDYLYVTNWSLWSDVRLIVQTLPVVLRRSGAN